MLEIWGAADMCGWCSDPQPPLTPTLSPFKRSERGEGEARVTKFPAALGQNRNRSAVPT